MVTESEPREITALIDHDVYSANGTFIGRVDDLKLDLDTEIVTGLALGKINRELFEEYVTEGQGVIVPYRWVRSVGDVVIVTDTIDRLKQANDRAEATE
ncbi:PRC-barrel domain-containing protein [Halocatena pleomorpha]|uniref:Photosystem reaction center subunit H n=1 Tax=Halocatena pleomorpha TaxID=1785090 RepID=A0A3P3RIN5_9EURY|nr:PRC-barrel domain-containing protein [Halocatena pleomorpha]RRJ33417.1 photosystem reaction center subunit H [Halocatena pleomorpha]